MSDHYTRRPSGLLVPAEHVIRPAEACNMLGFNAMMMGASGGSSPAYVTSGLVAMWDIRDTSSYPRSGTTVSNLVSSPADGSAQSAYNLTAVNGAFNNTYSTPAGNQWGFDPGGSNNGYLVFGANTTFLNSLHKAGAAFTIEVYMTVASSATHKAIFSSEKWNATPYRGAQFYKNSSNKLAIDVENDTTQVFGVATDSAPSLGSVSQLLLSVSAGGSGFIMQNGAAMNVGGTSTFSVTYTSPSSSDPALVARFLQSADGAINAQGGDTFFMARLYTTALTTAQGLQNYNATKATFGL